MSCLPLLKLSCLHLQVIHAFQITFDQTMEHQPLAAPSNVQFLNMADTSVRRLVKMAKNLAHFRKLDQRDQISLLKGAIVEVLVLRSSKMFNSQSMSWQVCQHLCLTRDGFIEHREWLGYSSATVFATSRLTLCVQLLSQLFMVLHYLKTPLCTVHTDPGAIK